MTTDRTTKALLLAVVLGLWANVAGDWLKPVTVQAQSGELGAIQRDLRAIANGFCANGKTC